MNRTSQATVLADRIETRYLRAGCGPTVVVLRPTPLPADLALDPLVAALAGQFKIIVPEFPSTIAGKPADEAGTVSWICGVLDGLGVTQALVLVSWQLSWLAAALRCEDPDRVQGIAILLEDGHPESVREAVGGFFGSTTKA
jgi:hypothetical protein